MFLLHGLNLGGVEAVGVEGTFAVVGKVWAGAVDTFGNANMPSTFFASRAILFVVFVGVMTTTFTANNHVSSAEERPMSPSLARVTEANFIALNPASALA